MYKKSSKILVTGGAGFIGSEFVRQGIKRGYKIVVVDKLTYAGDLKRLKEVKGKYRFYKVNICNRKKIEEIFKKENPQIIVNFAAETHVDRSIVNASPFIQTNVKGTQVLLDVAKRYNIKRFIQISTDEVYGEIKRGKFSENHPLSPNSPYAASKAAADLLIRAYIRTYDFPAIIIRASNNYGPWQYSEKFIPVVIKTALFEEEVPIYGEGINVREWLHVSDFARAILLIMGKGSLGEIYNVGSEEEEKNIDVAKKILFFLNKPESLIGFVKDRLGHDLRYSLDSSKVRNEFYWEPEVKFNEGLKNTVMWYFKNKNWLMKF